jgi:hypothetical protein
MLNKAEADPGCTLFKCTMAILYLAALLKNTAVCRDTMPEAMWDNLQEMRRATNPLMGFFSSADVITRQDPDNYVSMDDFNEAFREYCRRTGVSKRAKLDAAVSHDVITMFGCSIVRGERYNPADPGEENKMGKESGWLVGGTLKSTLEGCASLLNTGRMERSAKGIEWAQKQALGGAGAGLAGLSTASASATATASAPAPMVVDSTTTKTPSEMETKQTGTTKKPPAAAVETSAAVEAQRKSRRNTTTVPLMKELFGSFSKMSMTKQRRPAGKGTTRATTTAVT